MLLEPKILAKSGSSRRCLYRFHVTLLTFINFQFPESKFVNVLAQFKNVIGLSECEIKEVTDYFKQPDGRVAYEQFCRVVSDEGGEHARNMNLISGLEWEDPMHTNNLSDSERRRLCVLLTKIAQTVRLRDVVLMPFFQDYEMVAKNEGAVTLNHFSRVLHFMGILLSEDDFLLLVKRYLRNSYTVNYVSFVKHIEQIDLIENFPGRLIDAELPKLPRPEIGAVRVSDVFGVESSFHPVLKPTQCSRESDEILLRIKRHVYENSIRVHDFFDGYDQLRTGYVTKNQFFRVLDNIGISALDRLYLTEDEMELVAERYADVNDATRVNWTIFENDINKVFTEKDLDKKPFKIVVAPPPEVTDLPRVGQANWQQQRTEDRSLCEQALDNCKARISKRRLYLRQYFQMFDKQNTGHVTRNQARQVIYSNGILLSNEEFYALERRYNDDLGFNYNMFLCEADTQDYAVPKYEELKQTLDDLNKPREAPPPKKHETDIVLVLAKVKRQVVARRIRIEDFLKDYDRNKLQFISELNFRRGLDNANIKLSEAEVDLLCKVFKAPLRGCCVNYKRFCSTIEEVFMQPCLERAPRVVPVQHIPSQDCAMNFLNFEERTIVSKALQKLSKHADHVSNLSCIFDDYDCTHCGTLSQNNFLRALTVRELHNLISSREFELVCKCFGVERGLRLEVDYRAFLRTLDILAATRIKMPF
ncbi:unnamed protein product [Hermetia illucens]|uniref:EF-hand domain-containing protein n=1 Tax=Hermetia illucens TaxID=343691 RepID=A0A7R8V1C6_HERIL|nr:unnamed protein product [Hermetia illucens]